MIAILLQTIRDLYRERLLYNVFFISLFLIFVGYLASLLAYGHQHRVILHFGTSIVSLTAITLGLTIGSRLIRMESESRTIYLPLVRPITRTQYFLARAAGVAAFILLNLVLLTAILAWGIHYLKGEFRPALLQWALLTWTESLLGLGLSLMLSMAMRPGLNIMSAMTFLFLSHNHEQMALLKEKDSNPVFGLFSSLTPDGSVFFLDTRIYYDLPISGVELLSRVGYGALWAAAFFALANALFHRRNL